MALINTSVPNLIQGVSQQPDASRFAGQCEEQENALSSVADGLKKRPNTRHIARLLTTAISQNSFVHFIDRDDNEKYVVIHDGSKLRVFNLGDGTEATINGATNDYYEPATGSYLDTSTPQNDLKALTIADNTFILNTEKEVTKTADLSDELPKEAIVYVAQGDYEKEYEVSFSKAEPFQIQFYLDANVRNSGGYYNFQYNYFQVETGTAYNRTFNNAHHWYIRNEKTAVVVSGGEGYKPNKTFADNYILYIDDVLKGSYNNPIPVKLETNSDGEVTAAKVQAVGFAADKRIGLHTDSNQNHDLYLRPPAPDGVTFNQMGRIVAKTGAADATQGGINADTKQIAYLLGYDSNEYSNGVRTASTTTDIISNTKLNQPEVKGSVIKYSRYDGNELSISATDGLGDLGLQVAHKEVNSISDLPAKNFNGYKVKVIGDFELSQDDYYVEFVTDDGAYFGAGSYQEVGSFGAQYKIDSNTLPHRLVNTGVNEFTFEAVSYGERNAGDDSSNPFPSFVGNKISNIFFFRNRLGFLSNGDITMSESGEFFNFFRTTVSSLLDSDPISVTVSSTRVTTLRAAVSFQENLILFADNGQFVLKGGSVLTPKNVSVTAITNFSYTEKTPPLPLGSYIYFPFTRGSYTGVREFTVNSTTDTYDSVEITEHVPAYITKNIVDMTGTTSEDMIVLLSGDEKGSLYIYNYFWNNNQKVLSAWSKFTFTGEVRGMEFIESSLYVVIVNNGETNLVEMPLESGLTDANGYVTHLDMRVPATVTNGSDTITLPYTPEDNSVEVYTDDGLKLNCTNTGSTVTLSQPVTANTEVFVGIPYTMKYTFSEQLFKAKAGNSTSPSNAAKLMVRNGSIYFDDTAYFQVKVTPKARNTSVNTFTPDVVGSTTIGSLSLDSGFYRFPVFTKAQDTTITIENDSALPSNFQSAEFESFVHSRSNRYG
jgi:hypothetical protein